MKILLMLGVKIAKRRKKSNHPKIITQKPSCRL